MRSAWGLFTQRAIVFSGEIERLFMVGARSNGARPEGKAFLTKPEGKSAFV
jgi:hypothetical protein